MKRFDKMNNKLLNDLNNDDKKSQKPNKIATRKKTDCSKVFFAKFVEKFCDSVEKHTPIDVKPAKLVMIMTQSLYNQSFEKASSNTEKSTSQYNIYIYMYISYSNQNNNKQMKIGMIQRIMETMKRTSRYIYRKTSHCCPNKTSCFLVDRVKNHQLWKSDTF
ncbi:hypothetical protein RFI_39324 [Reticulomyxa filosa]|uniref:Uncharacterized protein n=1 Tax=Reticulomyxa filosa TaxID=46433 RepID=X6L9Z5_RETFI|nr:hypothetical protein RFI_39324 [Reticulomyxa filosa]|eukprot:ETN98190.1 hypothetical protein RFI_39324 [Reticulomyxa filosa]